MNKRGWHKFSGTNYEYYDDDGMLVIDMFWHSSAGHDIAINGHDDGLFLIPDHIKTLDEAMAWAVGIWRTS